MARALLGHGSIEPIGADNFLMPLLTVVITLIVVGVLLWLVNTYIPMDNKIKTILNAVVVIAVVIWLLYAFGVLDGSSEIRLPRVQ